jgi:hypothetical protein
VPAQIAIFCSGRAWPERICSRTSLLMDSSNGVQVVLA